MLANSWRLSSHFVLPRIRNHFANPLSQLFIAVFLQRLTREFKGKGRVVRQIRQIPRNPSSTPAQHPFNPKHLSSYHRLPRNLTFPHHSIRLSFSVPRDTISEDPILTRNGPPAQQALLEGTVL
jgi:hypothetical protein